MLSKISTNTARKGLHYVLEGRWLLLLSYATRAVDSTDMAAGIAVATTVGHALCPGVRVGVNERGRVGTAGNWWHYSQISGWGHSVLLDGWSAEVGAVIVVIVVVGADFVGDNGDRIGTISSKACDLGKRRVRGKARWFLGQHGGFPLPSCSLLLGECLLFTAHAGRAVGADLVLGRALAKEREAGSACCSCLEVTVRGGCGSWIG